MNLHQNDYRFLNLFVKKLQMLGITSRILWKTARNPLSLYNQISAFGNLPDLLILIDQMDHGEDIAKSLICDWFSLPEQVDGKMQKKIRKYCDKRKIPLSPVLERYAKIPKDAILIQNPRGLAPGFIVYAQSKYIIVLPHKLEELEALLDNCIVPVMAGVTENKISVQTCHVIGMEAEAVECCLEELLAGEPVCFQCIRAGMDIEIRLSVYCRTQPEADQRMEHYVDLLRECLQPYIWVDGDEGLAERFASLVDSKSLTISVADGLQEHQTLRRLKGEFPQMFAYLVDANPMAVAAKVLEVPEYWLNDREGMNEMAGMYMACGIRRIDNTQIGLSAKMGEDKRTLTIGIASPDKAVGKVIRLPEGGIAPMVVDKWIQVCVLNFCLRVLAPYPELAGGIPAKELQPSGEGVIPPFIRKAMEAAAGYWPEVRTTLKKAMMWAEKVKDKRSDSI